MTDKDPERSLKEQGDALGKRLKQARKVELGPTRKEPKLKNEASGLGQAFRIGTELLSALIVGVGIGWGLDKLLGTKPIMMILFIFLGGAAGIYNVYKTAMRMVEDLNESEGSDATNGAESDPSGPDPQKK